MMQGNRPLIGVISDRRMQGPHPFHMVGEKYLRQSSTAPRATLLACRRWLKASTCSTFSSASTACS